MVGLAETQFDVKFRLLGVPVRIHPFFWLVSAVHGMATTNNLPLVVLWVLCVFVSIMVHEYGHALMSKAFGYSHRSCSGEWVVFVTARARATPRERLAVVLAGPGAGFLLLWLGHAAGHAVLQDHAARTRSSGWVDRGPAHRPATFDEDRAGSGTGHYRWDFT